MNLKHLYYFWKTAKSGGVVRAAQAMNLTPQTVSGQIRQLEDSLDTQLFSRVGRSMELTAAGQLALEYADEMFSLGAELELAVRHFPQERPTTFHVGVSDAVPKSLAYRLLQPALDPGNPVRIICREWRLDRLLTELAVHHLDLVIADAPIPASVKVRGYNQRLMASGLSFVAPAKVRADRRRDFPACLDGMPFLMPGEDSSIRRKLDNWLEKMNIRPRVVGEFDDMALLGAFGNAGAGAFAVPTAIEDEVLTTKAVRLLGRIQDIRVEYFAISVQRKSAHACVQAVTAAAGSGREFPLAEDRLTHRGASGTVRKRTPK